MNRMLKGWRQTGRAEQFRARIVNYADDFVTGREYIGRSPSKKSVNQMKRNVGEYLTPGNNRPWEEVRDRLHRKRKGWKTYFGLGSTARAYRAIDEYVEERVRAFPEAASQGVYAGRPSVFDEAGNPHVRFDERG